MNYLQKKKILKGIFAVMLVLVMILNVFGTLLAVLDIKIPSPDDIVGDIDDDIDENGVDVEYVGPGVPSTGDEIPQSVWSKYPIPYQSLYNKQTPAQFKTAHQALDQEIWTGLYDYTFHDGNGSKENPYLIRTAEQLALLARLTNNPRSGGDPEKEYAPNYNAIEVINGYSYNLQDMTKAHYRLIRNIRLNDLNDGNGWQNWAYVEDNKIQDKGKNDYGVNPNRPKNEWIGIGVYLYNPLRPETYAATKAIESFDGDGLSITGMYTVKSAYERFEPSSVNHKYYRDSVGLFGTYAWEIKNLIVNESYANGFSYVGVIAGSNSGNMINCSSNGRAEGDSHIGGLTGTTSNGKGKIVSSSFNGTVKGRAYVGGLAGSIGGWGGIYNSVSHATFINVAGSLIYGGLAGRMLYSSGGSDFARIYNSVNYSTFASSDPTSDGALVGGADPYDLTENNFFINSYSVKTGGTNTLFGRLTPNYKASGLGNIGWIEANGAISGLEKNPGFDTQKYLPVTNGENIINVLNRGAGRYDLTLISEAVGGSHSSWGIVAGKPVHIRPFKIVLPDADDSYTITSNTTHIQEDRSLNIEFKLNQGYVLANGIPTLRKAGDTEVQDVKGVPVEGKINTYVYAFDVGKNTLNGILPKDLNITFVGVTPDKPVTSAKNYHIKYIDSTTGREMTKTSNGANAKDAYFAGDYPVEYKFATATSFTENAKKKYHAFKVGDYYNSSTGAIAGTAANKFTLPANYFPDDKENFTTEGASSTHTGTINVYVRFTKDAFEYQHKSQNVEYGMDYNNANNTIKLPTPTAASDEGFTYRLDGNPVLPTGLIFNINDRTIKGTPTANVGGETKYYIPLIITNTDNGYELKAKVEVNYIGRVIENVNTLLPYVKSTYEYKGTQYNFSEVLNKNITVVNALAGDTTLKYDIDFVFGLGNNTIVTTTAGVHYLEIVAKKNANGAYNYTFDSNVRKGFDITPYNVTSIDWAPNGAETTTTDWRFPFNGLNQHITASFVGAGGQTITIDKPMIKNENNDAVITEYAAVGKYHAYVTLEENLKASYTFSAQEYKAYYIYAKIASESDVTLTVGALQYNAAAQLPVLTMTHNNIPLTLGRHYRLENQLNNINANDGVSDTKATVDVVFLGAYSGSFNKAFTISKKQVAVLWSSVSNPQFDFAYNYGAAIDLEAKMANADGLGGKIPLIIKDRVTGKDISKEVGSFDAKAIIPEIYENNYTIISAEILPITIKALDVSTLAVEIVFNEVDSFFVYKGADITPTIKTLKVDGYTISATSELGKTNFSIAEYSNATNAGQAGIHVAFGGNFIYGNGAKAYKHEFTITQATIGYEWGETLSTEYTGYAVKPTVIASITGINNISGTYSYKDNVGNTIDVSKLINVGNYVVIFNISGTETHLNNFTNVTENAVFYITKKTIGQSDITVSLANGTDSFTYSARDLAIADYTVRVVGLSDVKVNSVIHDGNRRNVGEVAATINIGNDNYEGSKKITFNIVPYKVNVMWEAIKGETPTVPNQLSMVYTGGALSPYAKIELLDGDRADNAGLMNYYVGVALGEDGMTVENINVNGGIAYNARAKFTNDSVALFKQNYVLGNEAAKYTITPQVLNKEQVTVALDSATYTYNHGVAIEPNITGIKKKDNTVVTFENTYYYDNNVNATTEFAKAYVIVALSENFSGSIRWDFEIAKANATVTFNVENEGWNIYTGKAIRPTATIKSGERSLEVEYKDQMGSPISVASYKVTVQIAEHLNPKNYNLTGDLEKTYSIVARVYDSVDDVKSIKYDNKNTASYEYSGAQIGDFKVTVVFNDGTIHSDFIPTVNPNGNSYNVGDYTGVITARKENKNYTFNISFNYAITAKNVDVKWQANADNSFNFTFNGQDQAPKAYVEGVGIDGERIDLAINGAMTNVLAGGHVARASLDNDNYSLNAKTVEQKFYITQLDITGRNNDITHVMTGNLIYNGSEITPTFSSFSYDKFATKLALYERDDYTLSYLHNTNASIDSGSAQPQVVISFRGNFYGTISVNFEIEKKELTIEWLGKNVSDGLIRFEYDGTVKLPGFTINGYSSAAEKGLVKVYTKDYIDGAINAKQNYAYIARADILDTENYAWKGDISSAGKDQEFFIDQRVLTEYDDVKFELDDDTYIYNNQKYEPKVISVMIDGREVEAANPAGLTSVTDYRYTGGINASVNKDDTYVVINYGKAGGNYCAENMKIDFRVELKEARYVWTGSARPQVGYNVSQYSLKILDAKGLPFSLNDLGVVSSDIKVFNGTVSSPGVEVFGELALGDYHAIVTKTGNFLTDELLANIKIIEGNVHLGIEVVSLPPIPGQGVRVVVKQAVYNGTAQTPSSIQVFVDNVEKAVEGYVINPSIAINVGTYELQISLIEYSGLVIGKFDIVALDAKLLWSVDMGSIGESQGLIDYDGNQHSVQVGVYSKVGNKLIDTISFEININKIQGADVVHNAIILEKGKYIAFIDAARYSSVLKNINLFESGLEFSIYVKGEGEEILVLPEMSDIEIFVAWNDSDVVQEFPSSTVFNGKKQAFAKVELTFSVGGAIITPVVEFISYNNNINVGTATVQIHVKNYIGTINKSFAITPYKTEVVWENLESTYGTNSPPKAYFNPAMGDVLGNEKVLATNILGDMNAEGFYDVNTYAVLALVERYTNYHFAKVEAVYVVNRRILGEIEMNNIVSRESITIKNASEIVYDGNVQSFEIEQLNIGKYSYNLDFENIGEANNINAGKAKYKFIIKTENEYGEYLLDYTILQAGVRLTWDTKYVLLEGKVMPSATYVDIKGETVKVSKVLIDNTSSIASAFVDVLADTNYMVMPGDAGNNNWKFNIIAIPDINYTYDIARPLNDFFIETDYHQQPIPSYKGDILPHSISGTGVINGESKFAGEYTINILGYEKTYTIKRLKLTTGIDENIDVSDENKGFLSDTIISSTVVNDVSFANNGMLHARYNVKYLYDIDVLEDGKSVARDVKVRIRIPDELLPQAKNLVIAYVNDDRSTIQIINPDLIADGFVTFTTNHFSIYGLVVARALTPFEAISEWSLNYWYVYVLCIIALLLMIIVVYSVLRKKYVVSFETLGEEKGRMHNQKVAMNKKFALTNNKFKKKDYSFAGWTTDPAGVGALLANRQQVSALTNVKNETVKLYAQWRPEKWTIIYDANGGTEVRTVKILVGAKHTEDYYSTKDGFKFIGWFTEEELVNKFVKTATIKDNMMLFAKWGPSKCIVKFNTMSGTPLENVVIDCNKKLEIETVTERKGYTFVSWCTDMNCEKPFAFNAPVIDHTILYAKWHYDESNSIAVSNGGGMVKDDMQDIMSYMYEMMSNNMQTMLQSLPQLISSQSEQLPYKNNNELPMPANHEGIVSKIDIDESLFTDLKENEVAKIIVSKEDDFNKVEKYKMLSKRQRERYDILKEYSLDKDGATITDSNRYDLIKIGREQLIKIHIKNDIIVAEMILPNDDLMMYQNASDAKIKQKPIKLNITDDEALKTSVDLVDINFNRILDEREKQKNIQREKARQRRLDKKED